jgi:hypothetical protein
VAVLRIAHWRASERRWEPLGNGLNAEAYALELSDGKLYVGGSFSRAGEIPVCGVAAWDLAEQRWMALGDTGSLANPSVRGVRVRALHASDSMLFVGGEFYVGDSSSRSWGVAGWNTHREQWSALGSGLDPLGWVNALATAGGRLFVGGVFSWAGTRENRARSIAEFDPATAVWRPLEAGIAGTVEALAVHGSSLFAAGAFTAAGKRNLARWNVTDRTWEAVPALFADDYRVAESLAFDRDSLYIGVGLFGTGLSGMLLRYDVGTGTVDSIAPAPTGTISALAYSAGRLYTGGAFARVGSEPIVAFAVLDVRANRWERRTHRAYAAPNWNVLALQPDERGGTYVAGAFQSVGFANVNNIARWDGSAWEPLAYGVNGAVRRMALAGDSLYVGGDFQLASGTTAPYFACWNRASGTWSAVGEPFDGPINAIAIGPAGRIFVGGEFTHVGTMLARGIAWWDGTRWNAFGVGPGNGVAGNVRDIELDGNYLYVGGSFISAGGDESITHLARWDFNALQWQTVGGGLDNSVTALHRIGGSLIVAGPFDRAGDSVAHGVARWDGSTWHPIGAGLQGARSVYDFTTHGNLLVATGGFRASGAASVNRIAVFDGDRWSEIGHGLDSVGRAVASVNGDIIIGGEFTHVDTIPSRFVAIWHGTAASIESPNDRSAAAQHRMSVSPNPLGGRGTVKLEVSELDHVRVKLIDARGDIRALMHDGVLGAGAHEFHIPAEDLASGMYVLRVEFRAGAVSCPAVVVR